MSKASYNHLYLMKYKIYTQNIYLLFWLGISPLPNMFLAIIWGQDIHSLPPLVGYQLIKSFIFEYRGWGQGVKGGGSLESCSCAFVTDFLKPTTQDQHSSLAVPCSLPGVGKFRYDITVRRACPVMVYLEPLGQERSSSSKHQINEIVRVLF